MNPTAASEVSMSGLGHDVSCSRTTTGPSIVVGWIHALTVYCDGIQLVSHGTCTQLVVPSNIAASPLPTPGVKLGHSAPVQSASVFVIESIIEPSNAKCATSPLSIVEPLLDAIPVPGVSPFGVVYVGGEDSESKPNRPHAHNTSNAMVLPLTPGTYQVSRTTS